MGVHVLCHVLGVPAARAMLVELHSSPKTVLQGILGKGDASPAQALGEQVQVSGGCLCCVLCLLVRLSVKLCSLCFWPQLLQSIFVGN